MQGDAHPSKLAVRDRRERVIAQLAESFARDELSVEEFEARIDAAYCSTTDAEFDALIADLRRRDPPEGDAMVVARAELVRDEDVVGVPIGSLARVEASSVLRAVFSNIERCDQSVVPRVAQVEAIFGNIELDLREAAFTPGVTELHVKAIFGNVEIAVPADISVEVHGSGVFGNFEGSTRTTSDPDTPTLRIKGSAIFGSVVVKTLPPAHVRRVVEQFRARRVLRP